jgi:hypothetical protein
MMISGKSIYCDCCGTEKLCEIVGGNIVIKDRRHGVKHVVVISSDLLLDNISPDILLDKIRKRGYIIEHTNGAESETAKQTEVLAAP